MPSHAHTLTSLNALKLKRRTLLFLSFSLSSARNTLAPIRLHHQTCSRLRVGAETPHAFLAARKHAAPTGVVPLGMPSTIVWTQRRGGGVARKGDDDRDDEAAPSLSPSFRLSSEADHDGVQKY